MNALFNVGRAAAVVRAIEALGRELASADDEATNAIKAREIAESQRREAAEMLVAVRRERDEEITRLMRERDRELDHCRQLREERKASDADFAASRAEARDLEKLAAAMKADNEALRASLDEAKRARDCNARDLEATREALRQALANAKGTAPAAQNAAGPAWLCGCGCTVLRGNACGACGEKRARRVRRR